MTRGQVLYDYFNSFGIPAYPNTSVPDDAELPYMTYENNQGKALDGDVNITVDMWFKSDSEAVPNSKVDLILASLKRGGKLLNYDSGTIWLKPGNPWSYAINTDDNSLKRRQLNISIETLQ